MAEGMKKIAVLGAGNMGAALIGGILKTGVAGREQLLATTRSQEHAQEIAARFGIEVTAGGNRAAAEFGDIVVLAVKPTTLSIVMGEIRDVLHEGQILLSLAASVPIAQIEKLAGKKMAVFRAMPNIPVLVEEGATAVACNAHATLADRERVEGIFRAVGVVCFVV